MTHNASLESMLILIDHGMSACITLIVIKVIESRLFDIIGFAVSIDILECFRCVDNKVVWTIAENVAILLLTFILVNMSVLVIAMVHIVP